MGHTKDGKFAKGNQMAKLRRFKPDIKAKKSEIYDSVLKGVLMLQLPWKDLKKAIDEDQELTAWEYAIIQAVRMNNTKFIQWAVEMIIGKAPQPTIHELKEVPRATITRSDGSVVAFELSKQEEEAA